VSDLLYGFVFGTWYWCGSFSAKSAKVGLSRSMSQIFFSRPPAFDFFLARNGRANVAEEFEMREAEDFIPRCESGGEPLAMFDHSRL